MFKRVLVAVFSAFLLSGIGFSSAEFSAATDPVIASEVARSTLAQARVDFIFDLKSAKRLLSQAQASSGVVSKTFDSKIKAQLGSRFQAAQIALSTNNERAFARATTGIWTSLLEGAYRKLETATKANDANTARIWLGLREYRQATRFTPPEADATLALEDLKSGKISANKALTAVQADVLDAYQSRLNDALTEFERNLERNFLTLATENAASVSGYFGILAPTYPVSKLVTAQAAFLKLETMPSIEHLKSVRTALIAWRAAPLSDRERNKRAAQTLRFLSLVPVEYARGVKQQNNQWAVIKDLEITESTVFWQGAHSAFSDLEPLLVSRNAAGVVKTKAIFKAISLQLTAAASKTNVPSADALRTNVDALTASLEKIIPKDWRRNDAAADLDVVRQQLLQLEVAAKQGDYDLAESARINAYAILESGTEARIKVFQPQLATDIESLFWNGVEPDGFARLISNKADPQLFTTSRLALQEKLREAARFVGTEASPTAAFVNALVIVFREGLEAVLILAALLGSLKAPAVRHLRRPLWMGAAASFLATILTFAIMSRILNAFVIFGEKLEAIVSVIAVAVLLVIMNWFFHNVYWNDHLANFHKKKHNLMGAKVGQGAGLALLGFTAMYREGFETVLFMQSLVLQSGMVTVLSGAAVALVLVSIIGVLVFAMQAKLPHKKMLIATGGMICVVLFVIVGNTVHLLQVVGWFSIHPLAVTLPYWFGLWLGTYATIEGIVLQIVAVAFVIGSYFVAEGLKQRATQRKLEHLQPAIGD